MTLGPFSLTPFSLAFASYLCAAVLALAALVFSGMGRWLLWAAYGSTAAGALFHTVIIAQRWLAGGHPPLSGLFNAVLFFSWTIVAAAAVAEVVFRTRWLVLLLAAAEVALFAYAGECDPAIRPLVPVLKSTWLTIHVFVYMIGYGVMAVGCFAAVCYYAYLFIEGEGGETVQKFDRLTYRFVSFGFPLLTAGLITGAVWADRTWGRYWGWDPKETWSLITWIIYAVFLHLGYLARTRRVGLLERRAALNWMAIAGFAAVIFTFFLLKYLPSADQSLHVYL